MNAASTFSLDTLALRMTALLTPWDTSSFGFAVGQIDAMECRERTVSPALVQPFFQWLDANDVRLVSCRLRYDQLIESMLLEDCGFRFVETVLHPYVDLSTYHCEGLQDTNISVAPAETSDIATLEVIAAKAFVHGRIHMDPRLGSELGGRRYSRWVRTSLEHPSQRLLKITDDAGVILGLFITEACQNRSVYWHLTAIAPEQQGRGYGQRIWRAMLARHAQEGMQLVRTTITAGNVPVLNLYSKLGFRFLPPESTFHWWRVSA